jgi:hypothetical protein
VITADRGLSEHERNMNIPTGIDNDAPVIARHEIDSSSRESRRPMNFVFVPGAWHGGWSRYAVGHRVLATGHTALALTLQAPRRRRACTGVRPPTHPADRTRTAVQTIARLGRTARAGQDERT